MANIPIVTTCTYCKQQLSAVPKRTFLGYRKMYCPACTKTILYPLTSGYRIGYWIWLGIMLLGMLATLGQGEISIPGVLSIIAIYAILKDSIIRKRVKSIAMGG